MTYKREPKTKLKPCTRCGGDGTVEPTEEEINGYTIEVDYCPKCKGSQKLGKCKSCGRWAPNLHSIEQHGLCNGCVDCQGVCYP